MGSGKHEREAYPQDRFYRLDNSAVFTAAIAGASGPFVFRLSCNLDESIRLDILTQALCRLSPRFPFLFVALGHGVFWHYLNPLKKPLGPVAESPFPAEPIRYRRNRPLMRVSAFGTRIACEFHHALTDGTGSMAFLRSLVLEYLRLRGVAGPAGTDNLAGIPRPGDAFDPEEAEDAYSRYFVRSSPLPDPVPKAFLIPGKRRGKGYRECIGTIPLQDAIALARSSKVSLTELLVAVHTATLQDLYEALTPLRRKYARKRVSVQVPVDLRKRYPSRTLRNFFLFAAPSIDLRLGHWGFDEILQRVHHQLRLGLEEKELLRQLRRNVGGERNPFGRLILLPIKTVVMRLINVSIGVGSYSGSLSNLGAIEVPEPWSSRIVRFSFLPSRAVSTGANVGVASWKNDLYISIGSLVCDRSFERLFFSRLAGMGLAVRIECNETLNETLKGATE